MKPRLLRNDPTLAEAALSAARLRPEFGYAEIATDLSIPMERATEIVRGWAATGVAVVSRPGRGGLRKLYRLVVETGAVATNGRTAEDNLWTAARGLKAFSPIDLAAHARTETVAVTDEAARAYCRFLMAAGYLRLARAGVPRKSEPLYKLIRNTGPKAPRERRVRAVLDPNTGSLSLIGGGEA